VLSRAAISLFANPSAAIKNDFGALHLKIRQRIFGRASAQFGSFGRREADGEWA
jgi:hypothetical protein